MVNQALAMNGGQGPQTYYDMYRLYRANYISFAKNASSAANSENPSKIGYDIHLNGPILEKTLIISHSNSFSNAFRSLKDYQQSVNVSPQPFSVTYIDGKYYFIMGNEYVAYSDPAGHNNPAELKMVFDAFDNFLLRRTTGSFIRSFPEIVALAKNVNYSATGKLSDFFGTDPTQQNINID